MVLPDKADLNENIDVYYLKSFKRTNQDTLINQRPIVEIGERVKEGQVIADGSSTNNGEVSIGKNILLAFMPWRGYNYEDSVVISRRLVSEDKFTSIHENYHPFFIFVSEKFSQNNLITQVNSNICPSPQGNNSQIDFRNVFVEKWIEKDNSPTLNRLLKICSYYNELGDTFDLPTNSNFKLTEKKFLFFSYRINFMVCGGTGVGKSTLINLLLQEKKSLAGEGFSQTSKIVKYIHKNLPVFIYDTPGFTLGKNDEVKVTLDAIKDLIYELNSRKKNIDIIFYLINSQSGRTLQGIEFEILKFFVKMKIKIFFVLTRVFNKIQGEQFKIEFENSLNVLFKDDKNVIVQSLVENVYLVDLKNEKTCEKLIKNIYQIVFDNNNENKLFQTPISFNKDNNISNEEIDINNNNNNNKEKNKVFQIIEKLFK
jgi:GTP-binding protein EngB required for normal cell division